MLLAAAAGVRVFVTGAFPRHGCCGCCLYALTRALSFPLLAGGIGGVHRGGESTWDVSADLSELGRTPVAVVCAGAKSILDIQRTLEVLETQGVAVRPQAAFPFVRN
jgi:pseudouridine-5'-phosphate glycosidase